MYLKGLSMSAATLIVLTSPPVYAQNMASTDGKAGFECKGTNKSSNISFNIDLKRKKIQWSNGHEEKILITQNEIRVFRDPYISMASEYMYSKSMDRTSLIFTTFYANKSTDDQETVYYQCAIVPVYIFGSQRKF